MPNVELLKADVRDELGKLERLRRDFTELESLLAKPPEAVPFYDRAAVGYYLHSFYNGCENIFRSIARFFENDLSPEGWHADLLKRMRLEVSGYRPAVIDEELYSLLNDFRGFRHIFRHAYTFDLDWERERLVAGKLPRTATLLHEQVEGFFGEAGGVRGVDRLFYSPIESPNWSLGLETNFRAWRRF